MLILVVALLATGVPAADFSLGTGIGAGYLNWNGWSGYSIAASGGPSLGFGLFGLSADFLLGEYKVTQGGQSMSFWSFGGLARVRFSVVQLGAGYGYIPGFTDETGRYYPGTGSPLLSLGVVFPLRLSDRVRLTLGAENVFVARLSGFYNPSATVGVAYWLIPPEELEPIQRVLPDTQPEGEKESATVKPGPVLHAAPEVHAKPSAPVAVTLSPSQQQIPGPGEVKPEAPARFPSRREAAPSFANQALGGGRGLFRTQSPLIGEPGLVVGLNAIGRNPRGAWAADGIFDVTLTPYSSRGLGVELFTSGGGLAELADVPDSFGVRYVQGFQDLRAGAKVSLLAIPVLKIAASGAYVLRERDEKSWRDPLAIPGTSPDRFLWLASAALQLQEQSAHGPNLLFNFGQCGNKKVYGAGAEFVWTAVSAFVEARSLQPPGSSGVFNTDSGDVRATLGTAVMVSKAVVVKAGYTWGIGKGSAPNELLLGLSAAALFHKPAPRGGVIVGHVTDFRTGKPLSASVTFLGSSRLLPVRSDTATGVFKVTGAPPGMTVAAVGADGYHPETLTVVVVRGETAHCAFSLRPRGVYGTIAGLATDASTDRPLRAAIAFSGAGVGATGSDSATGAFRVGDVPAGVYSVSAAADGYFRTSRTVTVEADKVAAPVFVLIPRSIGAKLTGKVTDRRTGTAVTAVVHFSNAAVDSVNSDSATGVYTAEAPAGSYSVAVGAAGYIGQTANVVLVVDRPAIRDFELVKEGMVITLRGISFDAGKATIRPESKSALSDAMRILSDNPTIRAEIQGHTDNRGSDESNMKLSDKRATAVVNYLVENCGIDAARLIAKGYGASVPIAGNDTKEGRAANQRIELVVGGVAAQK